VNDARALATRWLARSEIAPSKMCVRDPDVLRRGAFEIAFRQAIGGGRVIDLLGGGQDFCAAGSLAG
jgi:hypothetical protein